MNIKKYLELLRVHHWFKNSIVLFGWLLAVLFIPSSNIQITLAKVFIGFLLASLVSSANYVVNQITDIDHDIKHPDKKNRPLPSGKISVESAFLMGIGVFLISFLISLYYFNDFFVLSIIILWIAGLIYNVRPIRAKDRPIIDVIVESSNNPIRFLIGWFTVTQSTLPPVSILLLTWSSAAILMTGKRYDELAHYGTKLYPYRKTFTYYNLSTLKLLLYFYSLFSILFMSAFAYNYDMDYLYTIPILILFLTWLVRSIIKGEADARSVEDFVKRKDFIVYFLILMTSIFIIHFK